MNLSEMQILGCQPHILRRTILNSLADKIRVIKIDWLDLINGK